MIFYSVWLTLLIFANATIKSIGKPRRRYKFQLAHRRQHQKTRLVAAEMFWSAHTSISNWINVVYQVNNIKIRFCFCFISNFRYDRNKIRKNTVIRGSTFISPHVLFRFVWKSIFYRKYLPTINFTVQEITTKYSLDKFSWNIYKFVQHECT